MTAASGEPARTEPAAGDATESGNGSGPHPIAPSLTAAAPPFVADPSPPRVVDAPIAERSVVTEPPPPSKPTWRRRGAPEDTSRVRTLTRKERKVMGRMRARKVRRVVRHVDPWSVLKLSLIFYFCLFLIVMVAGVILWNIASQSGTIDNLESLVEELGSFETFRFEGDTVFRASALAGLILVITGTGLNVLLAVLFNLISDLVGGLRLTVIEEKTVRRVRREEAT